MAFMRDPYYILMQDGEVLISTMDGMSSVNMISQDIFDQIVMMRYHNMTEGQRKDATTRALLTQFETGADGIRKANGMSTVWERVEAELKEKGIDMKKIDAELKATGKDKIYQHKETPEEFQERMDQIHEPEGTGPFGF